VKVNGGLETENGICIFLHFCSVFLFFYIIDSYISSSV